MPEIADPEYFTEIEAHFALRRGTPFVLSAKDWALMKGWRDGGVPLPVVIEAIDSVFEKNEASGRRKVISSLSYCRHAVKELWNERRELLAGAGGEEGPEAAPGPVLSALAAELETNPNVMVSASAAAVRGLSSEKSVPRIEERLIALEKELIEGLVASMTSPERSALDAAIASSIGDSARLDEKTRARTLEANLRRAIRERFELPRFTLFR